MREFLSLATVFGLIPSSLKNPYIITGAILVIALIILVVALFLFRNSSRKKGGVGGANPTAANDWQRQQASGQPGSQGWGQQAGGWGAPAQPGGWDANAAQQQQPSGWGVPPQPQQPAGWGSPASPQQQQPAWGAPPSAQQQPATWGTPAPNQQPGWGSPAQPQQPAGWGTPASAQQQPPQQAGWGQPGVGGSPSPSWDQAAASAPQDPWGQQSAASPWSGQNNQQQAPGQPWGQTAQAADPWGQPVQQQMQPGVQASWPGSIAQPSTTPPGGNPPVPSWQQQAPGLGQSPQGFSASPFDNPDSDRTMLRPSGAGAPASQGRMGIVRIEEGKEPGRVYEVHKESLSIGRSRESDIFLEDLAVSRLHASIISMGSGNYALRDEGSANGTKVNGQTVNKYQPYPLQEGDKIQLGQTVLVFARR
ncbi:MAG TPA: FHA domain-containing protein [Ktedonobacteraceae bacterium]|nr:FHA domain-containing protein [Ktedonobacteraceae bacterium]